MDQPIPTPKTDPPFPLDWLLWGWEHFKRESATVKAAPVFFCFILLAGLVIGSIVASAWSASEVRVAHENEKFYEDHYNDVKNKLGGTVPEEMLNKFSEMRRRVNAIFPENPRHLSDSQKKIIRDKLKEIDWKPPVFFVFSPQVGDSVWYLQDFVDTFKDAEVSNIISISSPCNPNEKGVLIGVAKPYKPTEGSEKFKSVIESAGISVSYTKWLGDNPQEGSYDLFICGEDG